MTPKKLVGTIMTKRDKTGRETEAVPEGEHAPELMAAAKQLQEGHQLDDVHKIASALKAAHEHLSGKTNNEKLHPESKD